MKWIITGLRAFFALLVVCVIFLLWHETLGRFMFFEITDPPLADPHRDQHIRDAYLVVYGTLAIVITLIASIRNTLPHAILASIVPCAAFLSFRAREFSQFFNPGCEELYWGARAMLIAVPVTLAVVFGIRKIRRQQTTASTTEE